MTLLSPQIKLACVSGYFFEVRLISMPSTISIIIPVLNEESDIELTIDCARGIADEVIVVDGGSTDGTLEIVQRLDCTVVETEKGRGQQLHNGAVAASGDILLFLHADTRLDSASRKQLHEAWESRKSERGFWGCFRQRIDSSRFVFRLIEKGNLWRAKYQRLPYGDQAVFVSREFYEKVGGIPQIPLMEDFEFARRAATFAAPIILPGPIVVDPRRWEHVGPIRQTIRNWSLAMRYRLGASPQSLVDRY